MNIDKIPSIGNIYKPDNSNSNIQEKRFGKADIVSLSEEAKQKFEETKLNQIDSSTEIRRDRVEEVKKKIAENPNYFNELSAEALDKMASRLIQAIMGNI